MSRGRKAERPLDIPASGLLDVVGRVKNRIVKDRLTLIAAGVAFYGMLAIFPAVSALLAIGGLVLDRAVILAQLDRVQGMVPSSVLEIIRGQAAEVTNSPTLGGALIVSVAVALWSASRGVNMMFEGLNVAYGEDEERGFIARNLQVLGVTLGMLLGFIAATAVIAGLPLVLAFLPLGDGAELAAQLAGWAALSLLVVGGLALLYRVGPSRRDPKWRWVSWGAVIAWLGWILASVAFTIYVSNFANYNESFGTLAGAVVLMMWLWVTVLVFLVGAEINAEMEHQTREDSTVGRDRPLGQRGAVMADTVGTARNEKG